MLTKEEVVEYQGICKQVSGAEISPEEACIQGCMLVIFLGLVFNGTK